MPRRAPSRWAVSTTIRVTEWTARRRTKKSATAAVPVCNLPPSRAGRGKGVWPGDNQNTAATYFLVYNPNGKPQPAQTNPEMSLQLGYYNSDGGLNTTGSPGANNVFNLAQMVVLNYMALHGDQAKFPTLYPAPNLNNTLGTGTALDALVSFAPIVTGKICGGGDLRLV